MDAIEKNVKNSKDVVRYTKNIDLRQVMDSLQVKVYATGNVSGRRYNKSQFIKEVNDNFEFLKQYKCIKYTKVKKYWKPFYTLKKKILN